MAQQQVHDMTGRECGVCGHKFTRSSFNMTAPKRIESFIEHTRVCGRCYQKEMK